MASALAITEPRNQTPHESARSWHLLKCRDFGFLFAGQAISQIGDGLNRVALLWFVYELTGSALKTTTIGLLQTLPPLIFGPLIGVFLDRWPKKRAMVWVDLIRTLMVALIPVLYTLQLLTLERLYLLVFLTSIFSTVFGPALASAVPLIVSRSQLTGANALIQTTTTIGILVGPAISGLGIAMIGAQNVLYVNAATFFISVLCLLPIRIREIRLVSDCPTKQASVLSELLAGFRFVFLQHRTVFALMIMTALYTVGTSAFVFLLPPVAKKILHIGPTELGWLWSAMGVGMLLSTAWLAWARQSSLSCRLKIIAVSLGVGGMAVCGFGMVHSTILSAAMVLLIGSSTAIFIPLVWAVLQEVTPEQMLGRVFTMFSTSGMAAAMIGMAVFGWAADAISPGASLLGVGGFLFAAACFAVNFSFRCAQGERVPAARPRVLRKLSVQTTASRA